jgi:PAS domain S-box-containing protein
MKAGKNNSKKIDDNLCQMPGKTRARSIGRAIRLLMISALFVGVPLLGFGTEDPLTPVERAWLKKHDGKIIVNNEAGWPPIIDADKAGNSFGIVMDFQRLIEKKLNFKFKLDKLDSWKNFMERFRKGEIDVNNNLQKNPKRAEYARFTKPYIKIPNVIIVRKEMKKPLTLDKMRGMKIAVTNNFAIHDYIKNNYDYLQVIPTDSDLNCLLETSTRNADAAVVNLAVASFIIEKMGITNLSVAGYAGYANELCFASRKDLPILNRILAKGLDLITQEERDAIYSKWVSLEYVPFYKNRTFWIIAIGVSAIIIAIILMILVWNRSLKKQVELRTEKLEKSNDQLKDEIADRKRAEEALGISEERYRKLVEKSLDAIILYRQKEILFANQPFFDIFGYEHTELKGISVDDILAPEVTDEVATFRQLRLADEIEKSAVYESKGRRKDGEIFHMEISVCVISHEGENCCMAFLSDISKRKRAEVALRESEERYRIMMEQAADAVFVYDRSGQILDVNEKACQSLGYSRDEMLSMSIRDISPGAIRAQEDAVWDTIVTGEHLTLESSHMRKDGSTLPVELALATVNLKTGRAILGIVRDISKRKHLESQLQQSQKMEAVGTLAGGIAHDFNNILAIILGNAELAADDVPDSNPASQSLKKIHRASIRAKDMVQQLLAFSRKAEEESAPINMGPILKESMKMLRSAVPTSIEFKQHISNDLCSIMGDAAQINQIVMNLVTNAADAMSEEGGLLEVTLERAIIREEKPCFDWVLSPGDYVRLKMRDTGEGIEPKIMDRIFEPYYTSKELGKGTGMGLSVVHGIVKRHGGGVRVESEPGKGTLFEIYFPALEKTTEEEKDPEIEIKGGSETILFVDDEEFLVDLNQERLERLGYNAISTTKPVEALEWFNADPDQFDVVITDMTMPRMTGDKLTAEVLKIRPHMPVIVCSGYSERMSVKRAEALGVRKYIEKPIDLRNLASAIREVLEGSNKNE